MRGSLVCAAAAALILPASLAAQSGNWWAPLSAELSRTASGSTPSYVCDVFPDLPACDDRYDRRRGDDRNDDRWDDRRDDDRWEDRRDRDRRGDWDRRRDDRRGNARGRAGRGEGPPFCRNGEGHPVHGRQWCRDKGWSGGGWRDVSWGDVILGPRETRRRTGGNLDRGGLRDVLGDVILGRLDRQGRSLGGGVLNGRFVEDRGSVLQVRAGSVPLAELLDVDRDGRVDRILLRTDG